MPGGTGKLTVCCPRCRKKGQYAAAEMFWFLVYADRVLTAERAAVNDDHPIAPDAAADETLPVLELGPELSIDEDDDEDATLELEADADEPAAVGEPVLELGPDLAVDESCIDDESEPALEPEADQPITAEPEPVLDLDQSVEDAAAPALEQEPAADESDPESRSIPAAADDPLLELISAFEPPASESPLTSEHEPEIDEPPPVEALLTSEPPPGEPVPEREPDQPTEETEPVFGLDRAVDDDKSELAFAPPPADDDIGETSADLAAGPAPQAVAEVESPSVPTLADDPLLELIAAFEPPASELPAFEPPPKSEDEPTPEIAAPIEPEHVPRQIDEPPAEPMRAAAQVIAPLPVLEAPVAQTPVVERPPAVIPVREIATLSPPPASQPPVRKPPVQKSIAQVYRERWAEPTNRPQVIAELRPLLRGLKTRAEASRHDTLSRVTELFLDYLAHVAPARQSGAAIEQYIYAVFALSTRGPIKGTDRLGEEMAAALRALNRHAGLYSGG